MILPYHWQGGGPLEPPPSGLFKIAIKPFELLIYIFVTFPKYEFNILSKKFSSIYIC